MSQSRPASTTHGDSSRARTDGNRPRVSFSSPVRSLFLFACAKTKVDKNISFLFVWATYGTELHNNNNNNGHPHPRQHEDNYKTTH